MPPLGEGLSRTTPIPFLQATALTHTSSTFPISLMTVPDFEEKLDLTASGILNLWASSTERG